MIDCRGGPVGRTAHNGQIIDPSHLVVNGGSRERVISPRPGQCNPMENCDRDEEVAQQAPNGECVAILSLPEREDQDVDNIKLPCER